MPHVRSLIRICVLLLCLALSSRPAEAQSFDCNKASTPVEHAVCGDERLRDLDSTLSLEVKAALARAPGRRKAVLADERLWLRFRDKDCIVQSKDVSTSCLTEAYRNRISYLQTHFPKTSAKPALGSCEKIAQRYRAIADAHSGEPPLTALSQATGSGVTLTEPLAKMNDVPSDLREWGSKQDPAIRFPDELTRAWLSRYATLNKLPGENFYWLSTVEGTAHCYQSLYFTVDNGVATKVEGPAGFDEEGGGSCGTSRFFGRLDQTSVFFEEDYDWTPRMSSTIAIATWQGAQLTVPCTVTFSFQPQFTDNTLNDWNGLRESGTGCTDTECDELRRAAIKLVAAVQDGPRSAQLDALAALTQCSAPSMTRPSAQAQAKRNPLGHLRTQPICWTISPCNYRTFTMGACTSRAWDTSR